MKIGLLTFHASHNYGSMLQAYALQQTIASLGHQPEIINFRTKRQRRFYRPFYRKTALRSKIRAMLFPHLALADHCKHRLFEQFMTTNYRLTPHEYSTFEELGQDCINYDAIVCGSDQIWNTSCFDHDRAYFLGFAPKGCHKIAYAPSMGPMPRQAIDHRFDSLIGHDLADFATISVREDATADRVEAITGQRPGVVLDPTLLLSTPEWEKLLPAQRPLHGDYILVYTPWYDGKVMSEALRLAQQWDLDVVVTQSDNNREWEKSRRLRPMIATGPIEFLSLIKNARLVVGTSFHAVVFSILFGRPFYAVGGMEDARISTLLRATGLEQFANRPAELLADEASTMIAAGRERLSPLRQASLHFLSKAINSALNKPSTVKDHF